MKHLLKLSVIALAMFCLNVSAQSPPTYFPLLTDMTNYVIPKINVRLTSVLGGFVTTNDGLGGVFLFNTNSAATVNTTNIFAPAVGGGRWERLIFPGFSLLNSNMVTNVTATLPITSSGGLAPNISSTMAEGSLIGRATGAGAGVMQVITDIPTAVTIGTAYIYRVGGTDVGVADGGTGKSTFSAGLVRSPAPGGITALDTISGTDGLVPYWDAAGTSLLTDADMKFVTDTLTITKVIAPTSVTANAATAMTLVVTNSATFDYTAPTAAGLAAAFNASKNLVAATTTLTELNYLSGVTSAVQTQLNNRVRLMKTGVVDPNAPPTPVVGDDLGQMYLDTATGNHWYYAGVTYGWLPY